MIRAAEYFRGLGLGRIADTSNRVRDYVMRMTRPPLTLSERQAILRAREGLRSIDPTDDRTSPEWGIFVNQLCEHVASGDLSQFLSWPVICSTMVVGNASYVSEELAYLKARKDWASRWQPAIIESPVGQPKPFTGYPASSGNLIHHAYHVAKFEETVGADVRDLSLVVEFGGGYGSMCRLFQNLGFSGRYAILDLPHFSVLQEYFLTSLGMLCSRAHITAGEVLLTSDIEQIDRLLQETGLSNDADALLLATWSMSETPMDVRERWKETFPYFGNMLLAYQNEFGGINNREYFGRIREDTGGVDWVDYEIPHLQSNFYMFGRKATDAQRSRSFRD